VGYCLDRASRYSTATSRALYKAIEELERLQAARKAREHSASSTDAEAAPPSSESDEGELGKQGGNNPGADTNPPEGQEDPVETVEVASGGVVLARQLVRQKRVILQNEPNEPELGSLKIGRRHL
jgi:hypothetical protein